MEPNAGQLRRKCGKGIFGDMGTSYEQDQAMSLTPPTAQLWMANDHVDEQIKDGRIQSKVDMNIAK